MMIDSKGDRPRPKLGSLEIGRFVAASIVVLTHLLADIGRHSAVPGHSILGGIDFPGAVAVQFFFVLSGFVMMTAHRADFGHAAAVPVFWWRRACRIYPAYWIVLLIPIHYGYAFLTPHYLEQLLTLRPVTVVDMIPTAWTLRYEVAFYIVFGLCLLPYAGRALLAVWVLAVCWMWCPPELLSLIGLAPSPSLAWLADHGGSYFLSSFEFFFFAGLLGGLVFAAVPLSRGRGGVLLAAGILGLGLTLPAMHWGHDFGTPMASLRAGLAFAAVMVGLATLERHGVLRFGRTARRLGAMSYPLYILHASLLLIVSIHSQGMTFGMPALYGLAVAGMFVLYALSAAFAFCIDQPLQRLLRRVSAGRGRWRRGGDAPSPPAPVPACNDPPPVSRCRNSPRRSSPPAPPAPP